MVRIREDPESSLARLREICLHLPGVTERLSHGEPTWFVRRSFVMY
ncbi:MAG: MmcQ/YjbR family DNA-binding protein, partial [Pseudonocardiaceae bacterium]